MMFGNALDLIIPAACFLIFTIGLLWTALYHERVRTPRARRELLDLSFREPIHTTRPFDRERDAA